jgi:hypothetical protein
MMRNVSFRQSEKIQQSYDGTADSAHCSMEEKELGAACDNKRYGPRSRSSSSDFLDQFWQASNILVDMSYGTVKEPFWGGCEVKEGIGCGG